MVVILVTLSWLPHNEIADWEWSRVEAVYLGLKCDVR